MTERKRKHRMKAEPVGLVDRATDPAQAFEQTDEERMKSRVYMATQQALLGPYHPRAARACVYGAALLCVEVGIEASKAVDAFREEYERVSASFDRIGKFPERLTASVGLERGSSSDQEKPQASDKRSHRL